jgi:DNA repair protein RAD50
MKQELKSVEEELATAKAAAPSYDTYLRLEKTEIPKLEKEIKLITAKLSSSTTDIDTHAAAVSKIRNEMKSLESLKRPIQDISRYTREIEDLQREITRVENQLGETGGALSGADIRAKMDSLNEQRAKLQKEQKNLTSEKEKARLRIQGMKDQISSLRFKLGEGENKVNAKKTFLRDIEDAKTHLQKAHEDVKVQFLFWSEINRRLRLQRLNLWSRN